MRRFKCVAVAQPRMRERGQHIMQTDRIDMAGPVERALPPAQLRAPRAWWPALLMIASLAAFGVPTFAAADQDHTARRFAWLANDPTNTYDNATLAGIRNAASVLGQTVDPFYAGFDINQQLAQCQTAIQAGIYSGLFVEADDPVGIEPCVAEAHKAGIPVVATDLSIGPDPLTVNPQVPGEVGASFIPAGHYASALKNIVPQACQGLVPCNVFYLAGDETLALDVLGFQAVESVIAGNAGEILIGEDQAFYDTATAKQVMAAQFTAHPEINMVVASGDQMALGVEQAAVALGLKMRILGAGAGASAIVAVKQGRWYATFNALPQTEGQLGAALMEAYLVFPQISPAGVDPLVFSGLPDWWTSATLEQHPHFVAQWPGP